MSYYWVFLFLGSALWGSSAGINLAQAQTQEHTLHASPPAATVSSKRNPASPPEGAAAETEAVLAFATHDIDAMLQGEFTTLAYPEDDYFSFVYLVSGYRFQGVEPLGDGHYRIQVQFDVTTEIHQAPENHVLKRKRRHESMVRAIVVSASLTTPGQFSWPPGQLSTPFVLAGKEAYWIVKSP